LFGLVFGISSESVKPIEAINQTNNQSINQTTFHLKISIKKSTDI